MESTEQLIKRAYKQSENGSYEELAEYIDRQISPFTLGQQEKVQSLLIDAFKRGKIAGKEDD